MAARDNKLLVRRKLAEEKILGAATERITDAEHVRYVLELVEQEVASMRSTLPEDLRLREAELASEKRRLENFLNFIAEGRGSKALEETERRVDVLAEDVAGLQSSREKVFPPPVEWIRDRLSRR